MEESFTNLVEEVNSFSVNDNKIKIRTKIKGELK